MGRPPKQKKYSLPRTDFEDEFWAAGKYVAGLDEAGRGALAGPVVAAAVIIPSKGMEKLGINDSKQLTFKAREELFSKITAHSVSYAHISIDNSTIEKINILQASLEAMKKAALQLDPRPHHLLVDGNRFNDFGIPFTTIVGGDGISLSVASASIVAKVTRDRWMIEADREYPQYGFSRNMGYGTREHFEAIDKYGPCPLHRLSFLQKFFSRQYTMFGE